MEEFDLLRDRKAYLRANTSNISTSTTSLLNTRLSSSLSTLNSNCLDETTTPTNTSSNEHYASNEFNYKENKKKNVDHKQLQTSNNSFVSIENACWFIASIVSIYYSDFFNVIFYDQTIYRSLMFVAFFLFSTNLIIALYLIVWLTHIKKVNSNKWNEKHPALIPIATACFVSGSILLTISIWPVYNWLTAPLLFTIFMGLIVVIIHIPSWI